MAEPQPPSAKRKQSRSPSYPGIDLGEAVKRARTLYNAEHGHPAPVNTILEHWGYEPKSGHGLVAVAALKKFGLLIDEGSGPGRKAHLSKTALQILLDEREDSTERQQIIEEAALRPAIHRELWDEYGGSLPSEGTLKHKLRFERNFSDRGVTEFIPQFRSTLSYAKLLDSGKLSGDDQDKNKPESEGMMSPATTIEELPAKPPSSKSQTKVIQLPIAPEEWAALQAPFPLTQEKWTQMLAVLEAMKPALVTENENR